VGAAAAVNFDLSDEQKLLQETVRRYCREQIEPVIGRYLEQDELPVHVVKGLAGLGVFGLPYPAEYGGGGAGMTGYTLALEEVAAVSPSLAAVVFAHTSPATLIHLYGTEGALHYDITNDRIRAAGKRRGGREVKVDEMAEIPIPAEKARAWRVEADFVEAIRRGKPIQFTDFPTGVRYMEFTEAVARSASSGLPVALPLGEFADDEAAGEATGDS